MPGIWGILRQLAIQRPRQNHHHPGYDRILIRGRKPTTNPESPTGPAKPPPILTTIPIIRSRGQSAERTPENPRGVRGFMRIPGIVKSSTEKLAESMRNNVPRAQSALVSNKSNTAPARSVPGPSQIAPTPSPRDVSPVSAITKDESRDTVADTLSPRAVEVAELDGHQLHNETKKRPRSITTTATSTTTHPHSDEHDDSSSRPPIKTQSTP